MKKIIIITAVYRRLHTFQHFVSCLKKQIYQNYILILVNDGAASDIDQYARKQIPNGKIIHGDGKQWWAGSVTKAYRFVRNNCDYNDAIVIIANDDISFESEFLLKVASGKEIDDKSILLPRIHHKNPNFSETGFLIDWKRFQVVKNGLSSSVDALTTRALYMSGETFIRIGKMYPRMLPQYLSDIEYTYRAKMMGYTLSISKFTEISVDSDTTGLHYDSSDTLKSFLYNHLLNKRSSFNVIYWCNFVLLACPWRYKIKNFLKVYYRFSIKLRKFLLDRKTYLHQRP